MNTIRKLFANAKVRLAARAVVAGVAVIATKYTAGNHDVAALEVAGVLAFLEIFTPLNSLVGFFKTGAPKP